jgi:iron complex outermembrane receptor protein
MGVASGAAAQTAASGSAPGGVTASDPLPGPSAPAAPRQASGAQDPTLAAPAAAPAMLQEVVVTAQRRRENLQDVPITVTAVSAAKLSAGGVQNTQDLIAVVPGLTFPSSEGTALPHIRGVGSTGVAPGVENSVALYVDGVYYGTAAGSILALNNVSEIEVLKGPQGTLFGRNATGGLIQVLTKDPTQDFHGDASVSYGNYDTTSVEGYVTGGLANNLAADFAVQAAHQGEGWGTDLVTGKDVYKTDLDLSLRSKLMWTPTDRTKLKLSFDYENSRSSQGALFEVPGTAATNPFYPPAALATRSYDVNTDLQPAARLQAGGVSLRIDQDLGFANLASITAYRQDRFFFTVDFDLGPADLLTDKSAQSDKQISQEFQLQSKRSSKLQYTLGLFYYHAENGFSPLDIGFGGALEPAVGPGLSLTDVFTTATQTTDSVAGFGQATYEILPRTNLTGGFRLTYESKSLNASETGLLNVGAQVPLGTQTGSFSVTKPTWRVALDHKFTDTILGYVSYNRGFKSGGYSLSLPTSAPFQTEELDAYELGVKTNLFDRRVRLNASGFYYNYNNIQVNRFINGTPDIYNGGAAEIYGLDVDLDAAVTDRLTFSAGLEALHDEFTDFPCADFVAGGPHVGSPACTTSTAPSLPYQQSAKGKKLPDTPNLTASLSADYRHPLFNGEADVSVTDSINSGYYPDPNNEVHQAAFNVLNTSIRWTTPDQRYFLRVWAKNLSDARYTLELEASSTGLAESLAAPRTYGVTVGTKF